jgi:hypothetical protein
MAKFKSSPRARTVSPCPVLGDVALPALQPRRLGFIAFGHVARAVARRARAFGLGVRVHRLEASNH